jgi:hypothetical protein
LRLENSATPDTGDLSRPLAACLFMAMVNALDTNPAFGKFVHNQCDEMLGGKFSERFGEWQEPTVMQRLGVI